jgi:hypothetical protein
MSANLLSVHDLSADAVDHGMDASMACQPWAAEYAPHMAGAVPAY